MAERLQDLTDERLMGLISQGMQTALVEIHSRYISPVYALTLRILQQQHAAEDASQETFLRVWQKAATFDPARGSLVAWLMTIARNEAIAIIRSNRRFPVMLGEDEQATIDLNAPGKYLQDTEWRDLRLALVNLPAEQRQVIELAYFRGMTHEEIAAVLKLPPGTVKSRILLGMRKLRLALVEY